jgi:hypothetical protein
MAGRPLSKTDTPQEDAMKKIPALAIVIFLTSLPAAAGNEGTDSPPSTAQAAAPANGSAGAGIRNDASAAKHGVKSTAREVKQDIKNGAQEVKYGFKSAWQKVKDFFKN